MHKYYVPEAITRKISEQINYAEDPFIIHRPSLSTINLIIEKANNIYQDSYFIDIPVFIATGAGDQYIKKNGIDYFAKGIKKELVVQKTYSNMLHDLYNDSESEVFFNDLLNWAK
jgi:esterase/lipase